MDKIILIIFATILFFGVSYGENNYDVRISRIESKIIEQERALIIAREQLNIRLEGMNEFRRQIDKAEGLYATKKELDAISRMVYMGLGGLLILQIVIPLMYFREKINKQKED